MNKEIYDFKSLIRKINCFIPEKFCEIHSYLHNKIVVLYTETNKLITLVLIREFLHGIHLSRVITLENFIEIMLLLDEAIEKVAINEGLKSHPPPALDRLLKS
jgi:hypothetical protein